SLCCVVLEIESQPGFSTRLDTGEDIAKSAGEPCRFLTEAGCGIYAVRPLVCRRFACDWLLGRQGLVWEVTPDQAGYLVLGGSKFHGEALPRKRAAGSN